jgi:hypothetical protein
MNTRSNCRTSPPTGIAGHSMPGSITASWRAGFGVSLRNAGCQIRNVSCSVSLAATTAEPTIATGANDVRRSTRVGPLDDYRPLGFRDDPANAEALNPVSVSTVPELSRRCIELREVRSQSPNNADGRALAAFGVAAPLSLPFDSRYWWPCAALISGARDG